MVGLILPTLTTEVGHSGDLSTHLDPATAFFGMPSNPFAGANGGRNAGMAAGGAVALGGAALTKLNYEKCLGKCDKKIKPPTGILNMVGRDAGRVVGGVGSGIASVGGGISSAGNYMAGKSAPAAAAGAGTPAAGKPGGEEPLFSEEQVGAAMPPDMPEDQKKYFQQMMFRSMHTCKQVCELQMKANGIMTAMTAVGAGLAARSMVNRRQRREMLFDEWTLGPSFALMAPSDKAIPETGSPNQWSEFLGDVRKRKDEQVRLGSIDKDDHNGARYIEEPLAEPEPGQLAHVF